MLAAWATVIPRRLMHRRDSQERSRGSWDAQLPSPDGADCTAGATETIASYLAEGAKIARDITARYGK